MQNSIMMARTLLEQRVVREDLLASLSSLAEPCWLILLQLFCADHADRRSATCIAKLLNVGIPTAERYFQLLEDQGFIRRSAQDRSSAALLEPSTIRAMETILEEMRQRSRATLNC